MNDLSKNTDRWAECEFGDLLDYIQPTNYIVESTKYNDDYKTPVLTAGKSFVKGYTNETKGVFDNLPAIIFDDFTTASRYVNFPFKVKSSAMKILIPSCELVNLKFLYYCMQANPIRSDTHKRYWISVYAKKSLLLPPLNEQARIVTKIEELFSELDKGIENLETAREQLKVYRQAVLKHAFEGKLTADWREENKDKLEDADELLNRIKREREAIHKQQLEEWKVAAKKWEKGGQEGKKPAKPRKTQEADKPSTDHLRRMWDLPNGWQWLQIGSFSFVTKLAGFEYTKFVQYDDRGDLPVIKAENAGPNGYRVTDYSRVKSKTVSHLSRSNLSGGELLVVFVGAGTGNVAIVPFDQEYFLGPNIGMVRPDSNAITTKYLELFLRSPKGKDLMLASMKAVAQPSLSMGTIRQCPVAIPSKMEQEEIIKRLSDTLSEINRTESDIEDQLEKVEALRQSILKQAFSGKLVSQNSNDEPAYILLERIKAKKGSKEKPRRVKVKSQPKIPQSKTEKHTTKQKQKKRATG